MKIEFKSHEYFSATTDIWSRSNRSFIAVSVHYIDESMHDVKTQFIACEHFLGRHTNDKVAEKLNSIFSRFEILEKVFFITTDGAGEFKAALKNYGNDDRAMQRLTNEFEWISSASDGNNNDSEMATISPSYPSNLIRSRQDSDIDNDEVDIDDDENFIRIEIEENENVDATHTPTFTVEPIFNFGARDDGVTIPLLPNTNRIGCSSHLMDKIGKKDVLNARNDEGYRDIHDRVFKKLTQIWDQKDSRLNSELFSKITGRKLIGPHRIRWLKTYDAVRITLFTFCYLKMKFNCGFHHVIVVYVFLSFSGPKHTEH